MRVARTACAIAIGVTLAVGAVTIPASATTVHQPGSAKTLAVHWYAYPYAHQSNRLALDPWGETERQCVSYAAWALNAMGIDFGRLDRGRNGRIVVFGDATTWAAAARTGGWTISTRPVIGAVAQWLANEKSSWAVPGGRATATAGSTGHVAIVTHVYPDGTVNVAQYNFGSPARSYSVTHVKAPRYLYIGVK